MTLPYSRDATFAPLSQVPSATLNRAQDEIIAAYRGKGVVISPAAITGSVDNYNPTDLDIGGLPHAQVIRQDLSAAATLTGLAGGVAGRMIILVNIDPAFELTLAHDVTSTAANRFECPGQADVILAEEGSAAILWYDGTTSRWRVISVTPKRTQRLLVSAYHSFDHSGEWQFTDGYMVPNGAGACVMVLPITLPSGVVITSLKLRVGRDNVSQINAVFKSATAAGTLVDLADVSSSTGIGSGNEDLDMSADALWPSDGVTVATDRQYYFLITADAPDLDLKVYFADVTYRLPRG